MKRTIVRVISIGSLLTLVLAILMSAVIMAGLCAGYLMNYLLPAIDIGTATIVGVLAFALSVRIVVKFMQLSATIQLGAKDDDDDIDSELISDEQVEVIADQVCESVIMKIGAWGNRRSARRR